MYTCVGGDGPGELNEIRRSNISNSRKRERGKEGGGGERGERERHGRIKLTVVSPGVNLLVLGYGLQKGQGIVWTVGRTEDPRAALQHPGAVQARAVTATR